MNEGPRPKHAKSIRGGAREKGREEEREDFLSLFSSFLSSSSHLKSEPEVDG